MVESDMCHECSLDFPVKLFRSRRYAEEYSKKRQGPSIKGDVLHQFQDVTNDWVWFAAYQIHQMEEHQHLPHNTPWGGMHRLHGKWWNSVEEPDAPTHLIGEIANKRKCFRGKIDKAEIKELTLWLGWRNMYYSWTQS